MKTKSLFICLFSLLFFCFYSFGQYYAEKIDYNKNKGLSGDVTINKSAIKIDGDSAYRIFEINAPEEGEYYFSAWLMATRTNEGYLEYVLQINNEMQEDKIKPEKSIWQKVELKCKDFNLKTVRLKKGINTIAFISQLPEIPEVEFVCLSKTKEKVDFSDKAYQDYISSIRKEIKDREKNPVVKNDTIDSRLKSILPNPEGDYYHQVNVPYRYTIRKQKHFTASQHVFFASYAADKYEHVLEVFSKNNTENYTWVSKSNLDGLAVLNITIPYTDIYYIRVRAYRQNTQGLVDLVINGQDYYEDCPVSGNGFVHEHTTSTTYNYFTCHVNGGYSWILIEDFSGSPGKIRAYDFSYDGDGDFDWGKGARVKKDFSVDIRAGLISSHSSFDPIGTCDVYLKCMNANDVIMYDPYDNHPFTICDKFPNLKPDDAILSADTSELYNCISWSGGRVDLGRYFWPPDYGNPWEANNHRPPKYSDHDLRSFDNFYKNRNDDGNVCVRDVGQVMNFYRSGANESNASVALWGHGSEDYSHASVIKPANNQPHGYDWESKPGGLMRTFHPRDALSVTYGNIMKYYRWDGTYSQGTPPMKSAIILETENLTIEKQTALNKLVSSTVSDDKLKFNKLYNLWKNTWEKPELIIQSNPRMFAKSIEYSDLLNFCINKGKDCWPLVFDKFISGDELNILLITDLTKDEYSGLMDEIKKQGHLKSAKNYVIPSQHVNYVNYISAILDDLEQNIRLKSNSVITGNDACKFYPIPAKGILNIDISISNSCNVDVFIYDVSGRVVNIKNMSVLSPGLYTINFELGNLEEGFYFCKVKTGGEIYMNKIQVQK